MVKNIAKQKNLSNSEIILKLYSVLKQNKEKFMSNYELCEKSGVNINTLRSSIRALHEQDIVERKILSKTHYHKLVDNYEEKSTVKEFENLLAVFKEKVE